MPLWDLSGEALRRHRCTTPEPDDLDPFWVGTLEAAQGLATTSSRRFTVPLISEYSDSS